jgi:hypothetical protein
MKSMSKVPLLAAMVTRPFTEFRDAEKTVVENAVFIATWTADKIEPGSG